MFFIAIATDYDGTIAHDGVVDEPTLAALRRLKESGRKLILVTGRELPDLRRVFPHLDLFDRIVAENGALLHLPATEEERPLGAPPPPAFVERLRAQGVTPLSVGRSIVATWEPNETIVLETIRELGLEQQIIFNKGAVMVLPPGVNKASGLTAALDDLGLSAHNVVGFGDAENDHAFLQACGCAVAVANALPTVKADADIVTEGVRGEGVAEVVERLIRGDAEALAPAAERHQICAGTDEEGRSILLHPHRGGVLIAGTSGGGKSTLATALLERLNEQGFQLCVLDPEGDYTEFEDAVALGDAKAAPRRQEVHELLAKPDNDVVVNMLALDVAERPAFFAEVLADLANLRAQTGRPHWILVEEAHHMLPAGRGTVPLTLPQELPAAIFVTVHPDAMSPDALSRVETVLGIGDAAPEVIASFCRAVGEPEPSMARDSVRPGRGEALYWNRLSGDPPRIIRVEGPRRARLRHTRKYAEGALGEDKSFWFRGPEGRLNLRAQNLMLFLQMADGVDEETWLHHLRAGDYSRWFREAIKDNDLAAEAAEVEGDEGLSPAESRARIRRAVERRYTAPAEGAEHGT